MEQMMYVTKADGTKQEFDAKKIVQTCARAGLSSREAAEVASAIRSRLYDGIRTRDIFQFIQDEIESRDEKSAYNIRLRDAIAGLDPVSFEIYVKELLEMKGYETQWNKLVKGKYVEHQVDVIASEKGKKFMVECKHHFNPHRFTGLGTCLQVQARMEDINASRQLFDSSWIFTNNKFSEHAKKYSRGIGIRLTGWRYEKKFSIESLINENIMFPVTILKVGETEKRKLLKKGVVTLGDVIEKGKDISPLAFHEAGSIV